MAYCTASDVRQIIHTRLSDSDVASIIETSDAVIDKRIGAQSSSDKAVKKLSMLITARTIKARQPRSVAAGEYREDAGDIMEVWAEEIEGLYRLYGSPTFKASEYQHIDEDERYPAEEGG
jgi:hypothetical protein